MAGKRLMNGGFQMRVNETINLLTSGYSEQEIYSEYRTRYNVSNRQINRYLKSAYDQIAVLQIPDLEDQKKLALMRLNTIYKLAYEGGLLRICLATQMEINKITGLYSPFVIESRNVNENYGFTKYEDMSHAELQAKAKEYGFTITEITTQKEKGLK